MIDEITTMADQIYKLSILVNKMIDLITEQEKRIAILEQNQHDR